MGPPDDRPVRVILADDHAMVREGMAEILSTDPGMEVVGQAGNGAEAVALARETGPDVVLLDVEMPVMGAQVALRKLLVLSPPPKVVIVTVFADGRLVEELLRLGASAYLSKGASMQDLLSAVRSVARGRPGGEDQVIVAVPRGTLEPDASSAEEDADVGLSGREKEVLLWVARGMSNRRVGEELYLSETTIKRHLQNVYQKLGVHTRGEAVSRAISEGWMSTLDIARND